MPKQSLYFREYCDRKSRTYHSSAKSETGNIKETGYVVWRRSFISISGSCHDDRSPYDVLCMNIKESLINLFQQFE